MAVHVINQCGGILDISQHSVLHLLQLFKAADLFLVFSINQQVSGA